MHFKLELGNMPRKNSAESGQQPPFDVILRETLAKHPNSLVLEVAKLWCNENDDSYLPQTHPLVQSLLALPIANGRKIKPIAKPLRGVPPNNWVLTSHWTANVRVRLDESVGGIPAFPSLVHQHGVQSQSPWR